MSTLALESRTAPDAVPTTRHGSITVYHLDKLSKPTIEEVDWAEQNLNIPTIVTFAENRKPVDIYEANGNWYRGCGTIVASPGGKDRFRINLRPEATAEDLAHLRKQISYAQHGWFARHGWRTSVGADGDTIYVYNLDRRVPDPATWDQDCDSRVLRPCTMPDCRDSYHEDDTVMHEADAVSGTGYAIHIQRYESATEWAIYVDIPDGDFSATQAAGLASDIQWMTAECKKLNAAAEPKVG